MADKPNSEKEPKRNALRRDSRPAARAKRDNLRLRRRAAKKRTKSRRSSKM
jgi:hypothetical protein